MVQVEERSMFVVIPYDVFEKAETVEELEDWLIANNEEMIARLRKAREEDLAGGGRTAEQVREELGL